MKRNLIAWVQAAVLGQLFLVVTSAFMLGCGAAGERTGLPQEGTPGETPVGRVIDDLEFGQISFYPEPGTNWTALIDMSVFDGFWPGMTGEDAVRSVGEPTEHFERHGERYWIYHKAGAKVTVAHKHKGSLFFGRWWRLEAELDPPLLPSDLLHQSVVRELPRDKKRYAVVIMNGQRNPAVVVNITNGQITDLDWLNNPGSGGAQDGVRRSGRTG